VLLLNEDARDKFKRPLGKVYPVFEEVIPKILSSNFIVSVGDATTNNLLKNDIHPNISIIDNLIQRKIHDHNIIHTENVLNAKNPPGTITDDLWETIELAIEEATKYGEKQLIVVEGEEDLAVLPCILMAPEDAIVLYGQPNEGLVFLNVVDVKNKANELLNLFKKIS
jgi:GTP-dependent dephospho-CoA kinase